MSATRDPDAPQPVGKWVIWLPLALFIGFAALAAFMLRNPAASDVDSKLVGQPVPQFDLPPALPGRPGLDSRVLSNGKVHLVNIFASWCVPCSIEAPQLKALADAGVPIEGISVRDTAEALDDFLERNGDPYQRIGADDDGKVQLELGSSGVPETFIVDGKGVIRYQHIGEIRPDQLDMILARVREAQQ